jgi:phage-related protein
VATRGNEVEIVVTSKDRSKQGFDSAEHRARGFSDHMGFIGREAGDNLNRNFVGVLAAGGIMGFVKSMSPSLHGLMDELKLLGLVAAATGATLGTSLIAGPAALVAMVGAAGVAGGAIIGLGLVAAAQAERVKTAFTGLKDHVVKSFQDISKPLEPVLLKVADTARGLFDQLAPILAGSFKMIAPILSQFVGQLGAALQPLLGVVGQVARSAGVLLRGLGPQLAPILGAIGKLLGQAAQAAFKFGDALFKALGANLPKIVGVLGNFLSVLAAAGAQLIGPLLGILTSLISAVLPPLAATLKAVAPQAAAFAKGLGDIVKALAPLIPAVLSIVEAFAPLLPILAQLVAQLVGALVPVLVPVIKSFGELAAQVGGNLLKAIQESMPSILQIIDAFGQLLPAIIQVTPAVFTLIQAITPLIPVLLQAAAAIITTLVPVLVPLISFLAQTQTKFAALSAAIIAFVVKAVAMLVKVYGGALRWIVAQTHIQIGRIQAAWRFLTSLPGLVAGIFARVRAAVVSRLNATVAFVRSIPGRIRGIFAGAAGWLFSAGVNIVMGLVRGITSRIQAAINAVASMASRLRGFLPFSPAKEGPLSGRGDPYYGGQKIVERVAAGIRSRDAGLGGAMGGAVGPGGGGPGGRVAGPAQVVLRIESGGSQMDKLLVEILRKAIRAQGGDVQVVLGT